MIRVPLPGKHISLMICVPLFPTWETHILSDMCSPILEIHISSDMCYPTQETHIPRDTYVFSYQGNTYPLVICVPIPEKHVYPNWYSPTCSPTETQIPQRHIPGDMCFPHWETHIPSDICFSTRETDIPSDMCSPSRKTWYVGILNSASRILRCWWYYCATH